MPLANPRTFLMEARYFTEAAAYATVNDQREAVDVDREEGDRLLHQLHGLSRRVLWRYGQLRQGRSLPRSPGEPTR